jgi:hypothetical protein
VSLGIRTFDPNSLGIRTCTDTEAIRNEVYSSSVLFFILYGYRGLLEFVLGVPVSVLLSVRIPWSTSISVVRIPGPQCILMFDAVRLRYCCDVINGLTPKGQ